MIGGAPKKNGFKGGIDDVRFWNLTHQGNYFVMPRHQIELPNPEKVERKGDQWYRGKALALRLTWNRYMYSTLPSRKKAGTEFNAEEIADLAVASGACGVLMKMRAPNGFAVFPSQYLPAKMQQDRDYVGEFDAIYPALASEYDAAFVPFLLQDVAAKRSLNQADGIHPTAAGHVLIAERLWKELQPILR